MNLSIPALLPPIIIPRLTAAGAVLLAFFSGSHFLKAQEISYPAKSGIIDITQPPYSAVGDGKTDNTETIKRAINDHLGEKRFIYFPKGTYLVSDRLAWRREEKLGGDGTWGCNLAFIGEHRDESIIRLVDSAPGFGNKAEPRAVVYTANDGRDKGFFPWEETGAGNDAFRNHIRNLTVDTGSGNPGAIGIDYHGHNFSSIEGVTIRSGDGAGVCGLVMTRPHPGPLMVKDLKVSGFDIAVDVADYGYSITMENIEIEGQKTAGMRLVSNVLTIRKLQSLNAVPAIMDEGDGSFLTLVDAKLIRSPGSETSAAIVTKGDLFARNIDVEGYPVALETPDQSKEGPRIEEFASRPVVTLHGSAETSLNLPVEETPFYHDNNHENWVYLSDFGAIANDNKSDHVAIQAAIDSGLANPDITTLVFDPSPEGSSFYETSQPIKIRGSIRKIVGMNASINPHGHPVHFNKDHDLTNPVLDFSEATVDTFFIDDLVVSSNKNRAMSIDHNSSTKLVLRSVQANYRSHPGAGTVFIQDFTGGHCFIQAPGQKVFARQLNLEGTNHDKIQNIGGQVWVLGLKTERTHRETAEPMEIRNTEGGKLEVLGAFIYPLNTIPDGKAMIVNEDSSLSIGYRTAHWHARTRYDNEVKDTQNGETSSFERDSKYSRKGEAGAGGSVVPLLRLGNAKAGE